MTDKRLFLLDGHALVYRAHFAFIARPLINSKGLNVSAITGFVRTLWDLIQKEKPSHIAVAFDPPGPTFRNEVYPEYKANREEQPDDIKVALPIIMEIVKAFHIPIVMVENFEADDVIGTLSKQAAKAGYTVYMVTPDKDYAQLVSDRIFMYKPSRQGNGIEKLGEKEVCELWDIDRVDQVIDVLGLSGDSVDNIPGIPGVGPKTATKWLKEFGSIEGVIENADQLSEKQREKVITFKEQALLSKELATINTEVPIQFDEKDFNLDPFDREKLTELFKELEFRTLARSILGSDSELATGFTEGTQGQLFGEAPAPVRNSPNAEKDEYKLGDKNLENTKHQYVLLTDQKAWEKLADDLKAQKQFSFDTETASILPNDGSVDPNTAELVCMSFSYEKHKGYCVPVPKDQEAALAVVNIFKPVLEDPAIEKIGQNIKYDYLVMRWYGVRMQGHIFDTMIAHYLIEPEMRHKLDFLAQNYLNYQMVPIEDLIGKRGKNQLSMRDVDIKKVSEYAVEDADLTLQLAEKLRTELRDNQMDKLYDTLEEPLIRTLAEMEFEGIRLDGDFLKNYSTVLEKQIIDKEKEIYDTAGVRFNIASPKQVGEVLFDRMKIPYRWRKTSTGAYSTNEEKLSELAGEFPLANMILEHRKLNKLKSTYVDALPVMINPRTGRIHTSYNQARAATGRLSSENPNLQNIPIRDEAGREIRKAFIARDEDHVLLSADYSQIGLRLIADISGEKAMLEAFENNQDIHRATAAKVYEVDYEKVTDDQRRNAKTVNFSIIYGAGATNLSRQLNIPRGEAQKLIEAYFKQYQGLKAYMDETVEFARKNGYVTTLLGRRRFLRDINSNSSLERSNAERMAINTPIQGTAADMIKVAMINIQRILEQKPWRSRMILQVHDELVFDMHKEELDELRPIIEKEMKNALPKLKVPILVGIGIGTNWLEAH